MRSLLVQASSVEKAVEKAWADAGMPTEFKIKVLDFGQKGFLGMTKKPAIVSIMYEPQKQIIPRQAKKPGRAPKKQLKPRIKKEARQKKVEPKRVPSKKMEPKKITPTEKQFWTDSLIYDVTTWLTEITKTLKISVPFKVKTNKKSLTLTFDRDVLPTREDERLLFSGLSYLLIQFLKKKYKKKYQGYRIVITSKRFKVSPSAVDQPS
jgi:predicted RNA-binding protein Jag